MTTRKILIMGLPGAGKTTLATELAKRLNAVHFNADLVRENINRDLGFSEVDRIEHARRMGWLCDRVTETGAFAIADFICPTLLTREAFMAGGPALVVFVDRIQAGAYADTNALFVPPRGREADIVVTRAGGPEWWAERIAMLVEVAFDPQKPTALFVGRYQPFHEGHRALIEEGIRRVGQGCIAVRDTHGLADNPFSFGYVRARIEDGLAALRGRFVITRLPNITSIFYGRDVGYAIERIDVDARLQAISATQARVSLGV